LRFLIDHCVPAGVASWLRAERHEAWTAYDAHLENAPDDVLIVYAADRDAILVTTNRDCAALARRLRTARVVFLRVVEVDAAPTMARAVEWLGANRLPHGHVLRVPKHAEPRVLPPRPW
jgi:predicted nuclease of predicted toxin-antitoxin system